jgi:hypothetical protein
MITNKIKIEKLELLLSYAIMKIDPFYLNLDKDEIWRNIDKIIKINEYIDKIKAGENIKDD